MNHPRLTGMLVLVGLVHFGCRAEETSQGTWVGNPGKMTVRSASGERLTVDEAHAEQGVLTGEDCDGVSDVIAEMETPDLLETESFEVPEGQWCGFALFLEPPVYFVGTMDDGGHFEVELDELEVWVQSDVAIESADEQFVFEVGSPGWLSPEEMDADDPSEDVVVHPDSEVALELSETLMNEATLFVDEDEDGEVGEAERDAGGVALAPDEEQEEDDEHDDDEHDDDEHDDDEHDDDEHDDEDDHDDDEDQQGDEDTGSETMNTVGSDTGGCGTCANTGQGPAGSVLLLLGVIGLGRRRQ